jgi:probable HAF family extracellular repeat protein
LGGAVSESFSINNAGQVAGYSDVPFHALTQQHAFLYSGGKMIDVGAVLSSLPNSFGYALNATGHIAGAAYDPAYSSPHAFFYNGSTSTDLGTFGGTGATVLALNDGDALAGYLTTTSMVDHAFVLLAGTFSDLGTLGGNYSYAHSINNSNVVVGGSFIDTNDSVFHAFIWNSTFALQDLNAQLDSSGAGWVLNEARAINDAGHIAGVGSFNGISHAFLLTPTTASTNNASPPELAVAFEDFTHIVLSFASTLGVQYIVQTNGSPAAAGWGNTATLLSGTGDVLFVTNSPAKVSPLFYRVRASTQ